MNINIFDHKIITPLSRFGLTNKFWAINIETIIDTWIAMACLFAFIFWIRFLLSTDSPIAKQIILFISGIHKSISNQIEDGIGYLDLEVFYFLLGILYTTLFFNTVGILPFLGEPTTDLNTTLALASYCFLFAQYQGLKYKGLKYFSKFFTPVFLMFPINLMSQSLKVASFSFRLFGNMIGGAILWGMFKGAILGKIFTIILAFSLLILFIKAYFLRKISFKWLDLLTSTAFIIASVTPTVQILFGVLHGIMQAYILTFLTSMLIASERSQNSGH